MTIKITGCDGALAPYIPTFATKESAAFDLCANNVELKDGLLIVGTGLCMEIPKGYYLAIYIRSSLAKQGYKLANGVGIIDSDYRGEVKLVMHSTILPKPAWENTTRIAQGILCQKIPIQFECVESLNESERGAGGFGSTGK